MLDCVPLIGKVFQKTGENDGLTPFSEPDVEVPPISVLKKDNLVTLLTRKPYCATVCAYKGFL